MYGCSVALLIAANAVSCTGERAAVPAWHAETGYRWRELRIEDGSRPGFTRVQARRSGVRFQNAVSDSTLANRMLGQGAGVALGDVDGDGLVDIFLAHTDGCSALYRNLGRWRFEDVAARAGVAACDRHSTGAAFADVDGDRDLDLVLLATKGPNAIFVNDGRGSFTERRDLGLDAAGKGGTTVALADVDGDGTLDLYVANYKAYHLDDSIPPQERSPSQLVRQTGPGTYEVAPQFRDFYKLVMRPDMGGLRLTTLGERDELYLNEGGRFRSVPLSAGRFRDAKGEPVLEEESFGLAARFADLDGDRAPELYVANDFEDLDKLWRNDGKGQFRATDWTVLRQMSNSSMGVDVADINGDGLPDLFVVDMLSNDSRRLRTQIPTHTALPKRAGDAETQLQQQRNVLFLNRGDGTFAEIAALAGVEASGWSWSTMFVDVDLDGWQDILIANGHLWDTMDADVHEGLRTRFDVANWRRLRWEFPPLRLRNVAFRNRGDLTFEDVSSKWRFGTEEDVSHAMAAGDLDADGDLDVVVNRLGSPALVLRNDSDAPRIAVRLSGDTPNTHAVGARIRLLGGAIPLQEREVSAGGLYLAHSDYAATFAMGAADSATLVVDWRDGRRSVIPGIRPNRMYEITTATALASRADAAPPAQPQTTEEISVTHQGRADSSLATSLFMDATGELGGHVHSEGEFDDWTRQFLLPNSLAQLGPGVAWFDHDRDGDEDLFVGTGRGGRLGVFQNDGSRLRPRNSEGSPATYDFTGVLGFPAGGDSAWILAGQSSWEGSPIPGASRVSSAVRVPASASGVGSAAEQLIPPLESSTGPLALADYDADGDLDLFVGGRVVPTQYPQNATSRLYRNNNGRFVPDSTNAGVLDRVGLVSAALFSDVTGDGHADLVLAREWDSILLLQNDGRGGFRRAADAWGLARWTSRWNGIAAGDLDADGRMDLIATSWGRNTMTPADSRRPLVVTYGIPGPRGEDEPVLAREDPRVRGLAPLNSYARLRVVIPDLTARVPNFATYADATLERIFGPSYERAQTKRAITLDHMAFMNRGDRFTATALPTEAQFAPAFYAGIADFDGDGMEDVFLSQNFYPTAVGLPRYDAGRGMLLRGDGKGGLTPQTGPQSGIIVYGDQRGAGYADQNGDGRLDLVVSQNAGPTRFFKNRGARPGLRVRLIGPAANPDGVGAQIRLVYGGEGAKPTGPVREVHAGSGYWSQDGAVQVFGLAGAATAVVVRWPGGSQSRAPISAGAREVTVKFESH